MRGCCLTLSLLVGSTLPGSAAAEEPPPAQDCLLPRTAPGICKRPLPAGYLSKPPLKELPKYIAGSGAQWQGDLRGRDVSALDLKDRTGDLLHADFDSNTVFPKTLPKGFDPKRIMDLGADPGLGVRTLHKAGITGKGVAIAIIDQALLVDHEDYAARLRSYEELQWISPEAQMHGGALASIAVGKRGGVAPEADVYFTAAWFAETVNGRSQPSYFTLAKAIDRVIELNRTLPKGRKIRALAIARGFTPGERGYAEVTDAVGRAKAEGIFVISSSLKDHYGLEFHGLGREPMSAPDAQASYLPGAWWQYRFFASGQGSSTQTLLVPMDSRTTASPTGPADYVFYREGGWSWAIPYIAGAYALACQVRPDITPERFWKLALETGDAATVTHDEKKRRLERIMNPAGLIRRLKAP